MTERREAEAGQRERREGHARRRRRGARGALALACVLVLGVTAPGAAEVAAPRAVVAATAVGGVTVTPSTTDLAGGFTALRLDVALQSDVPLADVIVGPFGDENATTIAEHVPPRAAFVGGELLPPVLFWGDLTRVSGTATDGVWRATKTVSGLWTGTWRLTRLQGFSEGAGDIEADLSGLGVLITVGTGTLPPWKLTPAPAGPVLVVTGNETWVPRFRVTQRSTGAGIPALITWDNPFDFLLPEARVPIARAWERADAFGYYTGRPTGLNSGDPVAPLAYAGRGSRGASLEAQGCLTALVKWQAREVVSTSGRTVTITGNAWPAPSIYPAANPGINLQVLVGSRWTTVTGSYVRGNGRYTLTWTAPAAGSYLVRAYKPGGVSNCGASVGVVLAAVPVVLR